MSLDPRTGERSVRRFLRTLYWSYFLGAHSRDEVELLVASGFEMVEGAYWRKPLAGGCEVALEPTLFGGHLLAIYRDGELVLERKLAVRIGAGAPGDD